VQKGVRVENGITYNHGTSYGHNMYGAGAGLLLDSVGYDISSVVIFVDANGDMKTAPMPMVSYSMISQPGHVTPGDPLYILKLRHNDVANCGYFDGHAKAQKADNIKPSMFYPTWTP